MADQCSIDLQEKMKKLFGETLSDAQIAKKMDEFEERLTRVIARSEKEKISTDEALDKILKEDRDLTTKQEYEKVFQDISDSKNREIIESFGEDQKKGIQSLMYNLPGELRQKGGGDFENTVRSVKNIQLSTLLNKIEREVPGGIDRVASGELDADIMRLNFDSLSEAELGSMSPESIAAFNAIKAATNTNHRTKISSGIQAGYRADRPFKQRHSSEGILEMGKDNYKKLFVESYDLAKSGIDKDFDEWFDDFFDKVTAEPIYITGNNRSSKKNSLEAKRSLEFKDGAAALKYNRAVNNKTIIESVFDDIDEESRFIGAASVFGPDPIKGFNKVLDEYGATLSIGDKKDLRNEFDYLRYGEEGNKSMKAKVGVMARRLINANKLHAALPSTITDIAFGAGVRSAKTGKNYFETLADTTVDQVKLFANDRNSKKVGQFLGVMLDDMRQDMIFGVGEVGGRGGFSEVFDKVTNKLMDATGLPRQSRAIRRALAKGAALDLSDALKLDFDKISLEMKDGLQQVGINEFDFNNLKLAEQDEILPGFEAIPIEAIEQMDLSDKFKKKIDQEIYKTKLAVRYNMFLNSVAAGSPNPGAKQIGGIKGTNPNTYKGQLLRFITQFKSFPIAVLDVGRTIYGSRGFNSNSAARMGYTITASMGLAYVSTLLKAPFQGKDVEKVAKNPDPIDIVMRAGFGGIWADFMLTDYGSPFRSVGTDLMGPGGQLAEDVLTTGRATVDALLSSDPKKNQKAKREFVDLLEHTTPAIPFTKTLINDKIFEAMHQELNTGRKPKRR